MAAAAAFEPRGKLTLALMLRFPRGEKAWPPLSFFSQIPYPPPPLPVSPLSSNFWGDRPREGGRLRGYFTLISSLPSPHPHGVNFRIIKMEGQRGEMEKENDGTKKEFLPYSSQSSESHTVFTYFMK